MAGKELATLDKGGALAVVDGYEKGDVRGKEGFRVDEMTLPQIRVCQAMSQAKDADGENFVEGVTDGDLFNDMTHTNYGKGPILFAPIILRRRVDIPERDEQGQPTGKILERGLSWDDPRCNFGPNGEKPTAVRHYDYLVYVPETDESAIVEFSSSKTKAAKKLATLIALREGPSWGGLYKLSVIKQEAPSGKAKYFNFKIDAAGAPTPEAAAAAERVYEKFKDTTFQAKDEVVAESADAVTEGGDRNLF